MFKSLLPSNRSALEAALDAAGAARLQAIPLDIIWQQWVPEDCPEHLLPWLAWALRVEDWSATWAPAMKRQTIANSAYVHQLRGTVHSIRSDLAAMGANCSYTDWRDIANGCPHTFVVDVFSDTTEPITLANMDVIRSKVLRGKALRDTPVVRENASLTIGALAIAVVLQSDAVYAECSAGFAPDYLHAALVIAHVIQGVQLADVAVGFN